MITASLLAVALAQGPKTLDLTPVGDVWVYPHSSNPGAETLMRVWGDGAEAIDKNFPPDGSYSYGFLQFEVPKNGDGVPYKILEAKLVVHFQKNEELTTEIIKQFPLEVRGLEKTFEEKSFSADSFKTPPYAGIFGKGAVAEASGENMKMSIDLNGKDSEFGQWFNVGAREGKFAISLTSTISPAESRGMVYRVFTKENDKALVPRLIVKVQ